MAYRVVFSPETEDHLRFLTAAQRSLVFSTVESQLAHQPTVETRNRKPMRPNLLATWELRVRNLRVYYKVCTFRDFPTFGHDGSSLGVMLLARR